MSKSASRVSSGKKVSALWASPAIAIRMRVRLSLHLWRAAQARERRKHEPHHPEQAAGYGDGDGRSNTDQLGQQPTRKRPEWRHADPEQIHARIGTTKQSVRNG